MKEPEHQIGNAGEPSASGGESIGPASRPPAGAASAPAGKRGALAWALGLSLGAVLVMGVGYAAWKRLSAGPTLVRLPTNAVPESASASASATAPAAVAEIPRENGGGRPAVVGPAVPGPATELARDLVVHLSFDGHLQDDSGNNLHGTAVGAIGFGEGISGQALRYSTATNGGSFNYVTLGSPAALNFGEETSFTVGFWARFGPGGWVFDPPFIANKHWEEGSSPGWSIATYWQGQLQWNTGGPPGERQDFDGERPIFKDAAWHHVVVVFDRREAIRTYVDGALIDTRPAHRNNVDTPPGYATNVGQDGTGRYTYRGMAGVTDGSIDDLALWRRPLTEAEVVHLHSKRGAWTGPQAVARDPGR